MKNFIWMLSLFFYIFQKTLFLFLRPPQRSNCYQLGVNLFSPCIGSELKVKVFCSLFLEIRSSNNNKNKIDNNFFSKRKIWFQFFFKKLSTLGGSYFWSPDMRKFVFLSFFFYLTAKNIKFDISIKNISI